MREIGRAAFKNCPIRCLKFEEGSALERIGDESFFHSRFYELATPSKLKRIGKAAFRESYVHSVTLNEGLEEIDGWCFAGTDTEPIKLPTTLKRTGEGAL